MYICLFFVVFGAIMSLVGDYLKKKRGSSVKYQQILERFRQQATEMLEPGEALEAVCGYNPCAAVTNKRLLVSTKRGIDSVPYSQIRKLRGMDYSAGKTTNPERMLALEIKANRKYTLGNHSEGFEQVAARLYSHTGL